MSERPASALVVDDDPGVRGACVRVLGAMGLRVESCDGLDEAVRRLERDRFDLVLTDLAMPDPGDGELLIAEVRRRDPAADILVMTGFPALESAVTSLRHGVYDYLVKPFGPAALQTAVGRCLEKRGLCAALAREASLRAELESAYGQLQKVERVKEAILSQVSHEFRAPLFTGFLALAALEAGAAGGEGPIQRLRDALERLQALVEDLLSAAAAARPGPARCRRETVDLAGLLESLAREARAEGVRRSVSVEVSVEPAAATLSGDEELLRPAFRHLLQNAVRFTRPATTVRVRAGRDGAGVRVTFADQGPGIAAGRRDRVFDGFYQAAEVLSRGMGGVGLGLAIARSGAEAHGGAVWVESEEGRGSVFTVQLPGGTDRSGSAAAALAASLTAPEGGW